MYLMVAASDSCSKCQFKQILWYTWYTVACPSSKLLYSMRVPGPNEPPTAACILSPKRSQVSRISSNQPSSSNVHVTNARRGSCKTWRSLALTRICQSRLQTFLRLPIFFSYYICIYIPYYIVLVLASGRSQGDLLPADKISRDLKGAKGPDWWNMTALQKIAQTIPGQSNLQSRKFTEITPKISQN